LLKILIRKSTLSDFLKRVMDGGSIAENFMEAVFESLAEK
jgi:hypothetical protein